MYFTQQNHTLYMGRDNAVNVDTTREQIYRRSTREHISPTNRNLRSIFPLFHSWTIQYSDHTFLLFHQEY